MASTWLSARASAQRRRDEPRSGQRHDPGSLLTREVVDLPSQRGDWKVPQSAFNRTGPTRNQISELRHAMGMSLEQVAHCIGAELATVALWEQDGLPAEEDMPAVFAMCDLFGCPVWSSCSAWRREMWRDGHIRG
jgi:DNA-binding XRE family transcriptional regulator